MTNSKPTNTKLIAMVGLPRSGKSTIARSLSERLNAPIVEPDAIRLALHHSPFYEEVEGMVFAIRDIMIRSLFGAGHLIVIVDETHHKRSMRDALKRRSGAEHVLFYPVIQPQDVLNERAIATDQAYLIPVIDRMLKEFESLEKDEERIWV